MRRHFTAGAGQRDCVFGIHLGRRGGAGEGWTTTSILPCCICVRRTELRATTSRHERHNHARHRLQGRDRPTFPTCSSESCPARRLTPRSLYAQTTEVSSMCRPSISGTSTHEVGQMDVAVSVQKDVVGLDIPVNYSLSMDVSQSTTQLGNPESHGLLGEGLPGDVESQVATAHQVDHEVPAPFLVVRQMYPICACQGGASRRTHMYSTSWKL